MNPHMTRLAACAVFGLLCCGAAGAQTPAEEVAINRISDAAAPCVSAPEGTAPSAHVDACESAMTAIHAAMDEAMSVPGASPPNPLMKTVYLTYLAMAATHHAAAITGIDGALTLRACQRLEDAWSAASQIDLAADTPLRPHVAPLHSSAREAVLRCRSAFGTPDGAVPAN